MRVRTARILDFWERFRDASGPEEWPGVCCVCSPRASRWTSWRVRQRRLMADAVKIQVEARDPQKNKGTGTRVARRLRAQGRIPAIIYGHKQAPTPISLSRDSVWEMIKKSTHLAELNVGGTTETALVRQVQWDHLGKEILHLDFARVSADEAIETEVRLELRGTAPGIAEGGVLEQLVHSVRVTCRANAIPDAIRVDLSNLHLNQALPVRDLTGLPEGM